MATIIGTNGDDDISGTNAADLITGLAGNDIIHAGIGDDVLDGGAGADVLVGGAGNDTYYAGAGDTVVEVAGQGTDTVQSDVTWTLGANLENLTLLGSEAINGTGNFLNNTLVGNSAANVLTGGAGNDTYYAGAGDTVVENVGEGTDTVQSDVTWTLGANLENLTLTGTAAIDGTGNSLNNTLTGNSAANVLIAGAGDDVLDGREGADVLVGGTGDDTYTAGVGDTMLENANEGTDLVKSYVTWTLGANLENLTLLGSEAINGTGNSLNNTLLGNNGANVLDGGLGIDTMAGGSGDDTYLVDSVNDVVTDGGGTDTVQSSAATYTLAANVENLTLVGTAAINGTGNSLSNTLRGNSGANVLIGGTGNDTYYAGVGDTVVENVGEGTDTVQSDVTWTLGANLERLFLIGKAAIDGTGNSLNNTLAGTGNNAANTLIGGTGDDTYYVGAGDTILENVNEGTDWVNSVVTWTLGANLENLDLTGTAAINGTGNSLDNTLRGNSFANVLDGGLGIDTLTGGSGDDTYLVDNMNDVVTEIGNYGTDTVQSSAATYTLAANVENLTLIGTAAINGTGNTLNNILMGNGSANVLNGWSGADSMSGGQGNDIYVVNDVGDVVTENVNEGTDWVQSSVTYTLGANVEDLTLGGTAAINGTGNSLNNTLKGNSFANVLDGGLGIDTLVGRSGDDTYLVDNMSDVVTEVANDGTDTVESSAATYTLAANVENLTLIGTAAINGTGNTLNNILMGNSGANSLNGGTGTDSMSGGQGNDIYVVDNVGDIVTENANEGVDRVQSSITYTLGANVEDLSLGGTAAINGTGNSLNNTLRSNSAANVFTGGPGNDIYWVSTGDSVVENANEGTDTVDSDVTWTLGTNIENLTLTGTATIDGTGNTLNNVLTGNSAANQLVGGVGNDTMRGGLGNDSYVLDRGEGQDTISENDSTAGNSDKLLYSATITPLDLILSRQVNNLRLAIYGSTDSVTIQNWYSTPTTAQVETIQVGNGQTLLSTQVDQLIQAMASFSQQTGLTWDQGISQQPQEVQTVLAASWHSS